jgi:hypothetical protein
VSQALAPHRWVQVPADLDPVRAGPAGQLVQPNLTQPAASVLVDRRPRSEAALLPLAAEVLEGPDAALTRPGGTIEAEEPRDVRIAVQGDQPLKVVVLPASQQQAGGLHLGHRRTLADGQAVTGRHSAQELADPTLVCHPHNLRLACGSAACRP